MARQRSSGAAALFLPLLAGLAGATSILLRGGTVIAFDKQANGLQILRNGSVLVEDDRITGLFAADAAAAPRTSDVEVVDVTGKIVTPGFIDTHRHGWQTAYKTLASNTSLIEYFSRYGQFAAAGLWTADDVYVSQLAGLYEAVNAGVTSTLDHAHHTWDGPTSEAGLRASIDSGARVFWAFTFANTSLGTVSDLIPVFRAIGTNASFAGSPTTLGIAYDSFGPDPNVAEVDTVMGLAKEFNVSVITTHSLQGPWGFTNSPEEVHALNYLNQSIPIVFSHASFLTTQGYNLLKATNQHISITPESEMHYGHAHPVSYFVQDQAALGVDTHFTYSTDVLTQARIWLQQARYELYDAVVRRWRLPPNNPMSVTQAFLLATRNGARALRREQDLGIIAVGAKADLVVWDGTSPSMLGWVDPVAAVMLHASVGDVESVLVDGKWVKKDRKLVVGDYAALRTRFLATARRIQAIWRDIPLPPAPAEFGGSVVEAAQQVDVQRGPGDGYGKVYI